MKIKKTQKNIFYSKMKLLQVCFLYHQLQRTLLHSIKNKMNKNKEFLLILIIMSLEYEKTKQMLMKLQSK